MRLELCAVDKFMEELGVDKLERWDYVIQLMHYKVAELDSRRIENRKWLEKQQYS